jgi:hypothetical protein
VLVFKLGDTGSEKIVETGEVVTLASKACDGGDGVGHAALRLIAQASSATSRTRCAMLGCKP